MFNYEDKSPDKEKEHRERRLRLGSFGALTAVIIGVVLAVVTGSEKSKDSDIQGILRNGDGQFDGYRDKLQVELIETIVHPNLIGMAQHELRARLTNQGERLISAIEVKGLMIGLDDSVITTSTAYPIPRSTRQPLPPGSSVGFSIKVDRPGNLGEELVKDHKLQLTGIRF